MEKLLKTYGLDKPQPIRRKLEAGNISAILENGSIRYITVFGQEIIRMIYAAVRTEGWLTVEPQIVSEEIKSTANGFEVKTKCLYKKGNAHFEADYTIAGNDDDSIVVQMDGTALTTFRRCRIGFCVLHPLEGVAGNNCILIHSDGSREYTSFPEMVSPVRPFTDIRAMQWEIKELGKFDLFFEGEIFETEDHRNWTDASFKTFCTPLNLPYPVEIAEGTILKQKITLQYTKNENVKPVKTENQTSIVINYKKTFNLPATGIGRSSRNSALLNSEIEKLINCGYNHYRIDLYTFNSDWKEIFVQSIVEAKALGVKLEIALFTYESLAKHAAHELLSVIGENKDLIERIIVFHPDIFTTPSILWHILYQILRKELPNTRLTAGTNANFAQLNYNRPRLKVFDELSFSIQPQEHAFDNLTLIENIAAQYDVVKSTSQFSQTKPVIISPVNIQRRFNANLEHFEKPLSCTTMPCQVDTRILSLFGAAWTCGSFLNLTRAGASSLTYFETVGERGVIMGSLQSQWPLSFPAEPDSLFPVFHVLKKFNAWKNKGYRMIDVKSSKPLLAEALVLKKDQFVSGMIFNYTSDLQSIKINIGIKRIFLTSLNTDNYDVFSTDENFLNKLNASISNEDGHYSIDLQAHEIIAFESER